MNPSNYPPGVTGNESEIAGDEAWERVLENIQRDCDEYGWTDMDCFAAWLLGRDALKSAWKLGAKFPHD
jgi:hypothetical protein